MTLPVFCEEHLGQDKFFFNPVQTSNSCKRDKPFVLFFFFFSWMINYIYKNTKYIFKFFFLLIFFYCINVF